jgi:LCP family protein required for cell wall assembly
MLAVLSVIVGAGAAYGFGFIVWADAQIGKGDIDVIAPQDIPCKNGCNYLVLGSDSREGLSESQKVMFGSETDVGGHRSDTIMIVHVDSSTSKAVILSFPRDLWVDIPGQGFDKLTSAYAGGAGRVIKTLQRLTGLRINSFLGVNLAAFEKVVDALGGVPICVDRPMHDELAGLNLPKAGCYDMDGFTALAFVRARHVEGDCIPDFSRIGRQQTFLRAVIAKVLSSGQLLHAPSLVRAIAGNLSVDNLNLTDLIALTTDLRGVSTGDADFRSVPGTPGTVESTGQSVVFMSDDAKVLFKRLRNGNPNLGDIGSVLTGAPPSPANIRIRVFDESSDGKATRVNDFLEQSGFDIKGLSDISSLRSSYRSATILYKESAADKAKVVHGFLPTLGQHVVPDNVLSEVDVAVIIPNTYNGPPIASPPPSGPGEGGTNAGC